MFGLSNYKNKIKQQVKQEVLSEMEEYTKSREQRHKECKVFELEEHINNLVICVPNEIQNVTVGYGKEITYITRANEPVLIVHDLVRNKDILVLGKIFSYTPQKFEAFNKLESNERIAILYNRTSTHHVDKEDTKNENPIPPEEWKQKVLYAIEQWQNNSLDTSLDNSPGMY